MISVICFLSRVIVRSATEKQPAVMQTPVSRSGRGQVGSGRVGGCSYRRTRKIKRRNSPGRDAAFPSSGCRRVVGKENIQRGLRSHPLRRYSRYTLAWSGLAIPAANTIFTCNEMRARARTFLDTLYLVLLPFIVSHAIYKKYLPESYSGVHRIETRPFLCRSFTFTLLLKISR